MSQEIATSAAAPVRDDRDYDAFRSQVRDTFGFRITEHKNLFTTDATGLFEVYLATLADRQHHTCHACRRFFERYAGLAVINAEGHTVPAFWYSGNGVPGYFKEAVTMLESAVAVSRVTGVFLAKEPIWGTPVTSEWTHIYVAPPAEALHRHLLQSPGQTMAEKREDRLVLLSAIQEFQPDVVAQALRALDADALYRSEKVRGPVKWFSDLLAAIANQRGRTRDNLIWRAVATAPAGWCHLKNGMAGTLLEDIAAGLPFEDAARKFAAKMHPLQYLRPQAAPSSGNIAQAEKIVEQLGISRSLERRYARLDELVTFWTPAAPKPEEPRSGGVFSHLAPKDKTPVQPLNLPATTMTWEKFAREVLPTAEAIEFYTTTMYDDYVALTTAVHADAPPILQWDHPDQRNPVAGYCWSGGSAAGDWELPVGAYVKVNAMTLWPSNWYSKASNQADQAVFILDGAKQARTRTPSLALFPETLKSELHSVRATIEAFSKAGALVGRDESSACGIRIHKSTGSSKPWFIRLRVKANGAIQEYKLDRWD